MVTQIILTGGTFDKGYNKFTGQLFFQATHLPEILSLIPITPEVKVKTLMMTDSLKMTSGDRTLS
jgi:L-asparaginase